MFLNSSYGSCPFNKEYFSDTVYMNGHSSVKVKVNKPEFRKATLLDGEMYEIEKGKKKITLDVPIQIGFTILNYAKLRMLEFYYDCLCKYIPRDKFECIQIDMDSLYFGLAHGNLQDAVYPHLRSDFDKKLTRTCGLFKEQYVGKSMIALCSKTYVVDDDGQYKLSCKGINKKTVSNPIEIMSKVLENQISRSSVNRGFRARDNTVYLQSNEGGIQLFLLQEKNTERWHSYFSVRLGSQSVA